VLYLLLIEISSLVLMKYGIRIKHTDDPNLLLKEYIPVVAFCC